MKNTLLKLSLAALVTLYAGGCNDAYSSTAVGTGSSSAKHYKLFVDHSSQQAILNRFGETLDEITRGNGSLGCQNLEPSHYGMHIRTENEDMKTLLEEANKAKFILPKSVFILPRTSFKNQKKLEIRPFSKSPWVLEIFSKNSGKVPQIKLVTCESVMKFEKHTDSIMVPNTDAHITLHFNKICLMEETQEGKKEKHCISA